MDHSTFVNKCAAMKFCEVAPLSEHRRLELDPTGKASVFVANLIRADDITNMTPPSPDLRHVDWVSTYQSFRMAHYTERHSLYWQFADEFVTKMGPQGGRVPMHLILQSLEESYTRAHSRRKFDAINYGHKILLASIKEMINRVGVPSPVPVRYLHTNAALPTMGKKDSFLANTIGMSNWRHVQTDLVGTRYQFQKPRTIHQDAISNVRYVEEYLARVRQWLVRYFPQWFGGWQNYRVSIAPAITDAIARGDINYEGDYYHMDEGFGRLLAKKFILPIFELLLDPAEFLHFSSYVEEMWEQPIFMGTFCLCGEHNLLSGVGPTQDFETYYSLQLHLGCEFVSGAKATAVAIIGDDSLALFRKKDRRAALAYKDAIEREASLNGMRFNLEKCRFDTPDYRFCKRIYYPGAPTHWVAGRAVQLGGYPYTRTMNTMALPERSTKPSLLVAAQLSRMDNALGSPNWAQFVDLMYKHSDWKVNEAAYADLQELADLDWWYRVYGERWDPQSSPSYRYLTSRF
nr:MAG: RNA-dependent RNA-polymerase [Picobirnavirus sp.]